MTVARVQQGHAPSVLSRDSNGKMSQPFLQVVLNPYFQPSTRLREIASGGRLVVAHRHDGMPTPYKQSSYLAQGSKGLAVSLVQWALAMSGTAPRLAADGKFGPLTKRAVESFQRSRRLGVDGVVGPLTLGALNEMAIYKSRCMS